MARRPQRSPGVWPNFDAQIKRAEAAIRRQRREPEAREIFEEEATYLRQARRHSKKARNQ